MKKRTKKIAGGEIFVAFPPPPLKPLNSIRWETRISNSNGFLTLRLRALYSTKISAGRMENKN
ncbi:hypothetical protein ACG2F4_15910, partial [Halalkalibaculum sp. DA3122]